jgi:tRNA (guanosine-2'-O-)-methyltransferase
MFYFVPAGSEKWLDVQMYNTTEECLEKVKQMGYRILCANLSAGAIPISEVDWTVPTAVLFGNELDGVSSKALEMADGEIVIPMSGFTESLNISVAASLVLSLYFSFIFWGKRRWCQVESFFSMARKLAC